MKLRVPRDPAVDENLNKRGVFLMFRCQGFHFLCTHFSLEQLWSPPTSALIAAPAPRPPTNCGPLPHVFVEGLSKELGTYRCIPTNPDYGTWHLNERQLEYVRMSGLYHLAQMRWIRIDHALITGLVERWRPETNTFHLPIDEATVTLEDVAYIYGLPINGPAVTSTTFPSANVADVCEELLGLRPQMGVDFNGISIKYTWLEQHFRIQADQGNNNNKKKKLSAEQEVYNTRAYLFFLVSGQINSNASSSRGPAYALELFRDFKPYAWAPACLANLYKMLNKGVRWAGLKKTDVGSDGKPVGIDPMDESDAFEHTFKSLSGSLQLLQIWAYSRMAIGRSIKPWAWPNNDIQFPLTITWHSRLGGIHHVTRLRTVRKQLNNLTTEQVVPPPFVAALPRAERIEKVVINYSIVYSADIELWEKRYNNVLHGKKSSKVEHNGEYMAWYSLNTIMHIGRPRQDDAPKAAVPEEIGEHEPVVSQKRVFELFDHIERSCGRAMDKNPASSMDRFITSLRGKMRKFKSAVEVTFDQYTETCSSSQSDEEKQLVLVPRHAVPKKPASKSPAKKKKRGRMPQPQPLNIDDSPLNASPPKNHVEEPKLHDEFVYDPPDEDVSNVPIEDLFSTSPCPEVFTTPPPVQQRSIVVARSPATIESLVWRLKNLPRTQKVPDKLMGFQHSITQSEYVLSKMDKEILDGFYKYYSSRKTELDAICSMVKSDTLYVLLEEDTLLDTNVIYYYFDCIRSSCKDAYLADPSICRLWLTQRFGDYGWGEPWVWTNVTKTDIPYQQNGTDCGFFAIGYAEHCIHRRPIRFTQADIPYYRRKILIEIFKRSWLMNADRLQLPNFPPL
ncbi:serine/threonine-protein phosphatase 7 long form [Cinnamomum micranthum f. kanehirae]|uniref:Serine/threonine-protein phosphatase 7 long form n=1 Tax=Cinnamomum micranthum f. kanehirae TaxID=337451 RepID=A0A443Q2B4_9MAGN|nr:serine/threonine-protein phosphatase 7 long form [Cinnamomum micranthum f. kanehirae]